MSDSLDDFVESLQDQILEETREAYGELGFQRWRNPLYRGVMPDSDGHGRVTGRCGDTIELFLKFEDGRVTRATFITDGCGSSTVCGSLAAELALGKNPDELTGVTGDRILEILGRFPKEDEHCSWLAAESLQDALGDYMRRQIGKPVPENTGGRSASTEMTVGGKEMKISICGKGGSGKSTVVALLAKQALARNFTVLVVDSDESNPGLFRMLGFEAPPHPLMELAGGRTMVKEKMGGSTLLSDSQITLNNIPSRYLQSRDNLLQISIGKILQAMEGCACPMGVLTREFLKKLRLNENEIAIVDMEAGVEHFGRGIDETIDRVVVVVEPSFDSLTVAEKVKDLASGMNKRVSAILNKTPSDAVAKKLGADLRIRNLEIIGEIPYDPLVFEAGLEGCECVKGKAFDAAGNVLNDLLKNKNKRP